MNENKCYGNVMVMFPQHYYDSLRNGNYNKSLVYRSLPCNIECFINNNFVLVDPSSKKRSEALCLSKLFL